MKGLSILIAMWCLLLGTVGADDAVFTSNGVKIRYVTAGQGEAVVLIHGWMADSSMWGRDAAGATRLNASLAAGFQLIALDCRGHGQSDKPHNVESYDAEVAADVVRLLDHLKIEKAHLVGYSSGSFIVGKFMATHPQRVLSAVFAGQAPILGAAREEDFSEVEQFARLVDEGQDLGEYLRAVSPQKLTAEQAKVLARIHFAGKDVKALAAAGRGFKKLAVTEQELNQCRAPIMFIHGGNESAYIKKRVAAAREALGRGEVKEIAGGDHITTLAKPAFGAALIEFLRSTSPK
ncbi:MAG TPA: alpha/beta hydrolase [Gemmatales bacterium]|nr:alpha/beta hydrolase [Gemmatales bacterium]HMP59733.1 alpha/beta hydrolase [Gemmatales bacterium]